MTREMRNINEVAEWGKALPKAWYHVRIKQVKDRAEDGSPLLSKESSQPMATAHLLVQEEPHVGALIVDNISLQPQALAKLKAYYKATGKGIFEDGSDDPEALVDGECFVFIETENYKGTERMKIAPYGIKPLSEGKPKV
jgi:hypothetical protein